MIDDNTRYAWVYPLHDKSDSVKAITNFVKERKNQDSAHVLRFTTGGGEYVNAQLEDFFALEGRTHKVTPPLLP